MHHIGRNAKDRIELSKLEAKLKIIENERKNEMRMHNCEAKRLHAKYSKSCPCSDSSSKAAGIEMYQTHNPGFCYKKNGLQKIPQKSSTTPAMDYQQIRSLVFTDDDLDVEKVLCLHLLSTHSTDSLKMPSMKLMKSISKINSPLERLLIRSKKINREKKEELNSLRVLPTYILDIDRCMSCTSIESSAEENQEQILYKDARLNNRFLVNEKIERVLTTTLDALEKSKSEKYKLIIKYSRDIVFLKKIFNKHSTQEFLKLLGSYSIITCPESFYLTPKSKNLQPVHLEIRTNFGNLESLVYQIRRYILQLPSKDRNEWKCLFELDENIIDDDGSVISQLIYDGSGSSKSAYVKKSTRSLASKVSTRAGSLEKPTPSFLGRSAYKNFIKGNIAAIQGYSVTRKVFENLDDEKLVSVNPNFAETLSQEYIPSNLRHYGTPVTAEPDVKQVERPEIKNDDIGEKPLRKVMPVNSSFIRKMNCCACLEKWKQPLPSPKIPSYKRAGLPAEVYQNPFKTNLFNQLSSMILDGLYDLDAYDTRYSLDNLNVKIRVPKTLPRLASQNEVQPVADSVEISFYDLAKISHEIADTETKKQLKNFLEEPL